MYERRIWKNGAMLFVKFRRKPYIIYGNKRIPQRISENKTKITIKKANHDSLELFHNDNLTGCVGIDVDQLVCF